jgi:hypothetical protein
MPRVDVDNKTLEDLKAKLKGDAYEAISAARMISELEREAVSDTRIIVTVYDKFYKSIGTCGNYLELACNFPRNQIQQGKLVIPRLDQYGRGDRFADAALTCHEETVPITIEIGTLLWSGRIKVAHDNFNQPDKADFVECELEGDYAWLMKIRRVAEFSASDCRCNFRREAWQLDPPYLVLKFLIGTQAFRLQSGMWDLINNLLSLNLDWRSWFGTFLMQDVGPDGPRSRRPIPHVADPGLCRAHQSAHRYFTIHLRQLAHGQDRHDLRTASKGQRPIGRGQALAAGRSPASQQ